MIFKLNRKCKFCNKDIRIKYSEEYDAYHCPKCGGWLENKCSDKNCEFCPTRPLTAKGLEES